MRLDTRYRSFLLVLAAGALAAWAAIDGRSFWIDEAGTAVLASAPSFTDLCRQLVREGGATSQMPLHVAYAWGWRRLTGSSEYLLRLSNVPWFLLGLAAIWAYWPPRQRACMVLLTVLSPFLWYYLNEFRPYVMQWSGAALAVGFLYRQAAAADDAERLRLMRRAWVPAVGLVILAGSSLLGAVWCAGACLAWAVTAPAGWRRRAGPSFWAAAACTGLALGLLAAYYGVTLVRGARASDAGRTGITVMGFVMYELFGFVGIGPGRLALRETRGSLLGDAPYVGPVLAMAVCLGPLVVRGALDLWRDRRARVLFALAFGVPALLIAAAGVGMHFRLLGRHFTPLWLLAATLLAAGMAGIWRAGRPAGRFWVCAAAAALASSSLELRLAPRHRKDAYRDAAVIARTAQAHGKTVWWAASPNGGLYYGLRLGMDSAPPHGRVLALVNPSQEQLHQLPAPDLIILSKRDLFDKSGALEFYLASHPFTCMDTLPAFEIWTRD